MHNVLAALLTRCVHRAHDGRRVLAPPLEHGDELAEDAEGKEHAGDGKHHDSARREGRDLVVAAVKLNSACKYDEENKIL